MNPKGNKEIWESRELSVSCLYESELPSDILFPNGRNPTESGIHFETKEKRNGLEVKSIKEIPPGSYQRLDLFIRVLRVLCPRG